MAEHGFAKAHVYNERGYPLLDGEEGRTSLRVRTVIRDTLYLVTTEVEGRSTTAAFDYFIKDGEDLQFLAFKFFDDPRRWHELATLNTHVYYPLDFTTGDYVRVPT
jgi:hypothetical protein